MTGCISQIQHGSTGDGPGLRTTVFFSGCNLRCTWCHNPETQRAQPTLLWYADRCTGCGVCAAVCQTGAHRFENGIHTLDRSACVACGACAAICPESGLVLSAQQMTLEQVMTEIDADRAFYQASGGGVTFSGGEPLLQPDFARALCEACRENGYHLLLDTAGDASPEIFRDLAARFDAIYFDWKTATPEDCKTYTGGNFERILSNLESALQSNADVTVRIPLIPGVNDAEEKLHTMGKTLQGVGAKQVCVIPFHRLGSGKYKALGMAYEFAEIQPMPRAKLQEAAALLAQYGFAVTTE